MRPTPTIHRGPRSPRVRRPRSRPDSHWTWTKRRGPVNSNSNNSQSNTQSTGTNSGSDTGNGSGASGGSGDTGTVTSTHCARGWCSTSTYQSTDQAQPTWLKWVGFGILVVTVVAVVCIGSAGVGCVVAGAEGVADAAVAGDGAVAAETAGDTVSVFHGSINDATSIARNGLDPGLTPTWVTRDLAAARNAIGPARSAVEQLQDPGIIESRIPTAEFEKYLAPSERPYGGFLGGVPGSSEIVLRTPEQIGVFNRYIFGSAG